MPFLATVLCAALLAEGGDQPADANAAGDANVAAEPAGGAGVSPVELIPRVEIRQAYTKLASGASVHDLVLESDIAFLRRLLVRYQVPARLIETPAGQISGIGDTQFGLVAILGSTRTFVLALLAGVELDTATKPQLGAGKLQPIAGLGAALKPFHWWLAYALAQEQFSVAGAADRPDVNQFSSDVGSILFGRDFNWLKLDLVTTVDFPGGAVGRLYGTAEAGSLVIGRVGLFARLGTELAGPRLVDYTLAAGIRYLFRLETGKAGPSLRRADER